jgi:hypothetical protein
MRPARNGGKLLVRRKGEGGPYTGYQKPITMIETLHLARKHSPDAMRTLIRNLSHEDGRISTMSASLILERAWGKPREAKPEEQQETQIDLTQLTREELGVLTRLALSGRLRPVPTATEPPPEIDTEAE